jgi:hypothetical protein
MHGELQRPATEHCGASRPALVGQVSNQSEQLIALLPERLQRRSERWHDHRNGPATETAAVGTEAAMNSVAHDLQPDAATTPVRRVNHQDLVTTAHLPGGEARFVAKGSHGHEAAPGNTRRSEPR